MHLTHPNGLPYTQYHYNYISAIHSYISHSIPSLPSPPLTQSQYLLFSTPHHQSPHPAIPPLQIPQSTNIPIPLHHIFNPALPSPHQPRANAHHARFTRVLDGHAGAACAAKGLVSMCRCEGTDWVRGRGW